MDNEYSKGRVRTIGFIGLLQLSFIILKLCKVIDWSWIYVFTPAIAYVGFYILLFIVLLICCCIGDSD